TFYVPPNVKPPASKTSKKEMIDHAKRWALAADPHTADVTHAAFSGERFATFDALAKMVEAGKLVVARRQRDRTNSAVELAAGARGRLRPGDRAGAAAM